MLEHLSIRRYSPDTMVRNIAPYSASEEYLPHVRTSAAAATASRSKSVSMSYPFTDKRHINTIVRAILPNTRSHLLLFQPIIRPSEYVAKFSMTATTNNSISPVRSDRSMLGCRQDNDIIYARNSGTKTNKGVKAPVNTRATNMRPRDVARVHKKVDICLLRSVRICVAPSAEESKGMIDIAKENVPIV